MAIRNHTDADFNSKSREVECKLEIYFDPEEPLTITNHDYIISLGISEESSAESKNPLGTISANELDLSLFNTDGIFSPLNEASPYYGLIKVGVKIIPYFRLKDAVDTLNWIQLGVFYVTDWKATITASTVTVYAMDKMREVLSGDSTDVQVVANYTFKTFYEYYFMKLGHSVTVDEALSKVIPFAYAESDIGSTLTDLTCAAQAMCYANRSGEVVVKALNTERPLRATITDSDQIVDISLSQSILKSYDGVALTYKFPQLTMNELVLDVENIDIPEGTATHLPLRFDKGPIAALSHCALQTLDNAVKILHLAYTPWLLTIVTENNTEAAIVSNLSAYGTLVEFTDTVLSDEADNMLTYSNKYLQTEEVALAYKAFLEAFVGSTIPVLEVRIRGNLLLQLGDKITVQSDTYELTFTGVIQRMKHDYQGFLGTTITLLNSEILEVE